MDFDEFGNPLGPDGDVLSGSDSDPGSEGQAVLVTQLDDQESDDQTIEIEEVAGDVLDERSDGSILRTKAKSLYLSSVVVFPEVFSAKFLAELAAAGQQQSTAALVGPQGSGKTALASLLLRTAYEIPTSADVSGLATGYVDEQELMMTLRATPLTYLLPTRSGKSIPVCLIDLPGHPSFRDCVDACLPAVETVVVVLDVMLGVDMATASLLRQVAALASSATAKVVLMLSKIDRLFLEARLPAATAFNKIRWLVAKVNEVFPSEMSLSPSEVLFSSARLGVVFSLETFAEFYATDDVCVSELVPLLWDGYYNRKDGTFTSQRSSLRQPPAFVSFVLEPIYKLVAAVLQAVSQDSAEALCTVLTSLRIHLPKELLRCPDPRRVLPEAFGQFLGDFSALGELLRSRRSLPHADSPSTAMVLQLRPVEKHGHVEAVICVSGGVPLTVGQRIYMRSGVDGSQMATSLTSLSIPICRGAVPVSSSTPQTSGQILLCSFPQLACQLRAYSVATLSPTPVDAHMHPQSWDDIGGHSVLRVGISVLRPHEGPLLSTALDALLSCWPALKLETFPEGGTFLTGTGEVMLNACLSELREVHLPQGKRLVEIKVTEPVPVLFETVSEASPVVCVATNNDVVPTGEPPVVIVEAVCEPLSEKLMCALLLGKASPHLLTQERLVNEFGFDGLAVACILTLTQHACIAADESYFGSSEPLSETKRDHVIAALNWLAANGPLAGECLAGVRFRILRFECSDALPPVRVIPAVKKALVRAFLVSRPMLVEPVLSVDIVGAPSARPTLEKILSERRGNLMLVEPIPGSPHTHFTAQVPVLDANGLETDLRIFSRDGVRISSYTTAWRRIHSDPLDFSFDLQVNEHAPAFVLARDLCAKLRRKKGLPLQTAADIGAEFAGEMAQLLKQFNIEF